jgi:hypothetical protein
VRLVRLVRLAQGQSAELCIGLLGRCPLWVFGG